MAWSVWAGAGLVLLLLGDVFFTVLHPQAHGGPVNRVLMRGIWRGFRAVARLFDGPARDRWLSMAGPTLSAATLGAWALLLVTGFALVYAAYPSAFTHTQWADPIGWGDAFYFSGIAASTLGMGDVLVAPGWLRVLTVAEGLLGFMLISISAAYILAIYSAQSDASGMALAVWSAVGDEPETGIGRLVRDLDAAEAWAGETARRLSRLTSDHAQYPILHYFRPPDRRQAMVPQSGILLRLFEQLQERHPGWDAGHPSLVMLHNVLGRYLEEVSRRFAWRTGIDIGDDDEAEWQKRHRQALRHLGYDDG